MAAQVLFWALPRWRHVVVHGYPFTEGNSVEVVRGLLERHDGEVIWLDGPDEDVQRSLGLHPTRRPVAVPMNSLRGLLKFLTARAAFFTHGLYWSIRPPRRKHLIDLWHGDGPKSHSGRAITSTMEVSGSETFGGYRADFHRVPAERLLLTGNPRIGQFATPASPGALEALGILPHQPFIVAMPTFRTSDRLGWRDYEVDDPSDLVRTRLESIARSARSMGVQLVVKRHPLDSDSSQVDRAVMVDEDSLRAARTTLYQVLGASAGLVTDYSSVWTDYLTLDRPIGFLLPDLPGYRETRGLHPQDLLEHLPGRVLEGLDDDLELLEEVRTGRPSTREARRGAVQHFGLVHPEAPTDALLDELQRRRVLPGLAPAGGRPPVDVE